jgi:hypothetical protein
MQTTMFCSAGAFGDVKVVGCANQEEGFTQEVDVKTLLTVFGIQPDFRPL